jgi:hypothetical protein
MEIMETQMRKKKDKLSCLVRTFEGFLCFILDCPFHLPKLLSSTPKVGREHSYLHPGKYALGSGAYMTCVSIACMYMCLATHRVQAKPDYHASLSLARPQLAIRYRSLLAATSYSPR